MLTGIDHLVIACADPDAAADELERTIGLRPSGGGRHERLGTFNRLAWLGDSYIELIGVSDRALAQDSWIGGPTVRALDAGGGLATWAVAAVGVGAEVAALRGRGSGLQEPRPGERVRPDGGVVRWTLSAARHLGPAEPPFLIEHDSGAAEWSDDDRAAREAEIHPIGGSVRLEGLELLVVDVARAGAAFLRTVGIGPFRPSLAGRGARDAAIGGQTLRLRPLRGSAPGAESTWPVATVRLRVLGATSSAARDVELLGCRWIVRPA